MIYFYSIILTITIISTLTFTISLLLGKKMKNNREKASPFECGFDPNSAKRLPFSLRFFLISIIFLIFDVEIAILLPFIVSMKHSMEEFWFFTSALFVLILLVGLLYEWTLGALEWSK
nr:NADH dehydrogenase subunit 3 [Leptodora kindtii]